MTTAIAIPLSEPTLEEYVSLLKTGVQSYFIQYWYEETNYPQPATTISRNRI